MFLQNAVLLLLGPDIRNYDASSFIPFTSGIHVGPLNVSLIRIIVIVTTVAVMVALTLWVGRSKLGRSMRAVSYDREGGADDRHRRRPDDHDRVLRRWGARGHRRA